MVMLFHRFLMFPRDEIPSNPMKTTIFLWFTYGFSYGFSPFSYHFPVANPPLAPHPHPHVNRIVEAPPQRACWRAADPSDPPPWPSAPPGRRVARGAEAGAVNGSENSW